MKTFNILLKIILLCLLFSGKGYAESLFERVDITDEVVDYSGKSYWSNIWYSGSITVATNEAMFYEKQAECDTNEPYRGKSSIYYYGHLGINVYATCRSYFDVSREEMLLHLEIDLSNVSPVEYRNVYVEYRSESRTYPNGYVVEANPLLVRPLAIGSSTQIVEDAFLPRWNTWEEWLAGYSSINLRGVSLPPSSTMRPRVWAEKQNWEVYSEPVRSDTDVKPVGDPAWTINGNTGHDATDIVVPCPGISLAFRRSYNSYNNLYNGPVGYGWTHSYNWFLSDTNTQFQTVSGGSTNTITNTWKVLQTGEGTVYAFKNTNDVYESPFDNN